MRRHVPCSRRLLCRRLRHPQPRSRGGGISVDEGGDDQTRVDDQRGENFVEKRPTGTRRLPRLLVRRASVRGERELVSGCEPVQEECATAQDKDRRSSGAEQQRSMAGSAGQAEQVTARLVQLLWLRPRGPGSPPCRASTCLA